MKKTELKDISLDEFFRIRQKKQIHKNKAGDIIDMVVKSNKPVVEIIDYPYKNANSCACALRHYMQTRDIKNIGVIARQNRVFAFREDSLAST